MTDRIDHPTARRVAPQKRITLANARNISWNRIPLAESVLQRSFGELAHLPMPEDLLALLRRIALEPKLSRAVSS